MTLEEYKEILGRWLRENEGSVILPTPEERDAELKRWMQEIPNAAQRVQELKQELMKCWMKEGP